jgi:curved DNA-binding protein CbpA
MTYFEGITTLEGLKRKYRELSKLNHPDLGGKTEIMQAINAEYEMMLTRVHDKEGNPLNAEEINIQKDIMDVINKIVALKGLIIEVTGRWIWVTGETRQYKEYFKSLHFFWAHKKSAWYWRPADAKVYNRRPLSLDAIRYKYGSINIGTVEREAIA